MKDIIKNMLVCLMLLLLSGTIFTATINLDIKKVYIVFKTCLYIGFTELSSVVEKKYIENFIPKAIEVAQQLRLENSEERYVWTTGSWVITSYLEQATEEKRKELDDVIMRGDIVWNSKPYTTMTEVVTKDHLRTILRLSEKDVGVKMLHVGVNK